MVLNCFPEHKVNFYFFQGGRKTKKETRRKQISPFEIIVNYKLQIALYKKNRYHQPKHAHTHICSNIYRYKHTNVYINIYNI